MVPLLPLQEQFPQLRRQTVLHRMALLRLVLVQVLAQLALVVGVEVELRVLEVEQLLLHYSFLLRLHLNRLVLRHLHLNSLARRRLLQNSLVLHRLLHSLVLHRLLHNLP
ncbi:unnamed protein product [Haemonchus placei]|uniref:Secreted protein n=1 Tax=Haemonchus placei TaxID=6290 RepID=A0A0N4W303_HAEPC|nr:unnamed protein product [Haemonchus placei]